MLRKIKKIGKKIRNSIWLETCAGGVCIRERIGRQEVLCVVHKKGGALLPKGRRKKGETLAECALREFQEETGLYQATVGKEISTIRDRTRGKKITFFRIFQSSGKHTGIRDEAIMWLTIEEANIMLKHSNEREVLMKYISEGERAKL